MICTIWQPSYTPYATPAPKVKPPPARNVHRRAYMSFGRSKTAQKVLRTIEREPGVNANDLVEKTKLIGVGQYVKTLLVDGYLECKLLPVPHAQQRVKHYYPASHA